MTNPINESVGTRGYVGSRAIYSVKPVRSVLVESCSICESLRTLLDHLCSFEQAAPLP